MLDHADKGGDPVLGLVFLRREEQDPFPLVVDRELVVPITLSAVHDGKGRLDLEHCARLLEA